MFQSLKYICKCCGKEQETWPALTYSSPDAYNYLTQEEKDSIGELKSDFCMINYKDQIDKYVRCTLNQKVIDHCGTLEYGLWVSLSDKSFQDYSDNFNNENHQTQYFGWLSNNIPAYNFNKSIPTTVITRIGNHRPEIIPHFDFEHPFVHDYYNGISKKEAEKRINDMLISVGQME